MMTVLPFISLASATLLVWSVLSWAAPALAQVIPDTSLPEATVVSPTGEIAGGTLSGRNLFHSFEQFSPQAPVTFNVDAQAVDRIIGRVTGDVTSAINAPIRASNPVDVLLLNPNGVIFGSDAALDVGGSFLATTARDITFADGLKFSSTPEAGAQPLLSVSAPVGLQLGPDPGQITVRGPGGDAAIAGFVAPILTLSTVEGLTVSEGSSLVLLGGTLDLEGGVLRTTSGRIELGAASNLFVGLEDAANGITLDYGTAAPESFASIHLAETALVEGLGSNSTIRLQGRDITLTDGSVLYVRHGAGNNPENSVVVNATGDFEASGFAEVPAVGFGVINSGVYVDALAGQSGGIAVDADRFRLIDGAPVLIFSASAGGSGDINITATDSIEIAGVGSPAFAGTASITQNTFSTGDSGDINILSENGSILIQAGGALVTQTTLATGSSGQIDVAAPNGRVEVSGFAPGGTNQPSAITTSSIGFVEEPGDATAGDISIKARQLDVLDGASVLAAANNTGPSGAIFIHADESVTVDGVSAATGEPSQISASAQPAPQPILDAAEMLNLPFPPVPSADSGNVTIDTARLFVLDGAQVAALNAGAGASGTVEIDARDVTLDSGSSPTPSSLSAFSASGQGGDINLDVDGVLSLENGAEITATAGGLDPNASGGDIQIDAELVVAFPDEDSDIQASATAGDGGSITIETEGIFGLSLRDEDTALSDLLVTSELGIDGELVVESPEIDPQSALVVLPENLVNSANLIATGCAASNADFALVGRGGLPADPTAPLQAQSLWQDLREPDAAAATDDRPQPPVALPVAPQRLVEAQGWATDRSGRVVLLAAAGDLPQSRPRCWDLQAINVAR